MAEIIYNVIATAALVIAVAGWIDNRRRIEMKSLKLKLIHQTSLMDATIYRLTNVGEIDVKVFGVECEDRIGRFQVSMQEPEEILRRNLHYPVMFHIDAHTRKHPEHVDVSYRSWTGRRKLLAVPVQPEPPYDPLATNQST
ncbi:hypothetical protein G7068_13595 [Leucobacter viscericola]|uniref:Uncharacterized protein n=1 Tax=Leucobacter viscericola TaxID=2714935 RepID=A0A6G7XHT9_9MICO|nr:hypothetical protein [Leucobacter viscericola]QIK64113.1 hypothetical protein G7068_13595 [Leucobacter viscericola]